MAKQYSMDMYVVAEVVAEDPAAMQELMTALKSLDRQSLDRQISESCLGRRTLLFATQKNISSDIRIKMKDSLFQIVKDEIESGMEVKSGTQYTLTRSEP